MDRVYSWAQERRENRPIYRETEEVKRQKRLRGRGVLEANQDGVFAAEGKGTGCPNRADKASSCESPISTTMTENNA